MINIVLLTFECTFTAVKTVTQILLLFLYRVSQRKQVGLAWIPLQNIKPVDYGILYRIFYIESTKFQEMLLQTDINEFSFFNTCFEFRQRLRQITQCLLWAQRWLPNNWLPHNLSLDEKKDVFREPIKLLLFNQRKAST